MTADIPATPPAAHSLTEPRRLRFCRPSSVRRWTPSWRSMPSSASCCSTRPPRRCSAARPRKRSVSRWIASFPHRFRDDHRRYVAAFGHTGDTSRSMGHLRPLAALRADGEEFPIEATIARVAIEDVPTTRRSCATSPPASRPRHPSNGRSISWTWPTTPSSPGTGMDRSPSGTRVPNDCTDTRRDEAIGRSSHDLLVTRHPNGTRRHPQHPGAGGGLGG